MTDSVLLHIDHHGVATLTLNREEKHNTFDDTIIAELTAKLKQVEAGTRQVLSLAIASAENVSLETGGRFGVFRM